MLTKGIPGFIFFSIGVESRYEGTLCPAFQEHPVILPVGAGRG